MSKRKLHVYIVLEDMNPAQDIKNDIVRIAKVFTTREGAYTYIHKNSFTINGTDYAKEYFTRRFRIIKQTVHGQVNVEDIREVLV